MTADTKKMPSLAILDDNLSVSPAHFSHIPSSSLSIEVFKNAMPLRTPEDEAALIKTLKPFVIISTMRERTSFPGFLLRQLPDLKLLLCTGTQLETFDMEVSKELGLPVEDEYGEKTFQVVSKKTLLQTADVITIHYVLSERSKGIVAEEELSLMKPTVVFVNTSRGPLVVERDLLDCASHGSIAGIALDVFDQEPLRSDSLCCSHDWAKDGSSRVLLSPHMGYVETDVMNDFYAGQAESVERWLEGKELEDRLV
ncbi:hypothetical protein H2204_002995 [Knufia peltigerae]|uniref:D-isomer specific 2-hydroxyacid dehydrogenase NAD-binding domain-containing protein n=1 Tax=Knufia peltigerae TaxID=1002370 RepID=A0AA38YAP3_9EURO|nr:hypothetical protein H2204_002995 [Knufia peltigerae]